MPGGPTYPRQSGPGDSQGFPSRRKRPPAGGPGAWHTHQPAGATDPGPALTCSRHLSPQRNLSESRPWARCLRSHAPLFSSSDRSPHAVLGAGGPGDPGPRPGGGTGRRAQRGAQSQQGREGNLSASDSESEPWARVEVAWPCPPPSPGRASSFPGCPCSLRRRRRCRRLLLKTHRPGPSLRSAPASEAAEGREDGAAAGAGPQPRPATSWLCGPGQVA